MIKHEWIYVGPTPEPYLLEDGDYRTLEIHRCVRCNIEAVFDPFNPSENELEGHHGCLSEEDG